MLDKKFHLFTWLSFRDCSCFPTWAGSVAESYAGSFSSIEDAQKCYQESYINNDVAEIMIVQNGEMRTVATLDDSGTTWTLETKQITNPPPPEPELEPIKPVLSKSTARNKAIREQINA